MSSSVLHNMCLQSGRRHPMTIDVIFLDVDSVLADWTAAAIAVHGLDPSSVYQEWEDMARAGSRPWDLASVLGISTTKMWAPIHAAGHRFWADLEPFEWAQLLYLACAEVAPTVLLTSPSKEPSSHSGKAEWIQRHFGRGFRDYLIGSPKHRCARPGAVLIDDSPEGCEKFEKAGGISILFPSVGNRLHPMPHNQRVEYIRTELAAICMEPAIL